MQLHTVLTDHIRSFICMRTLRSTYRDIKLVSTLYAQTNKIFKENLKVNFLGKWNKNISRVVFPFSLLKPPTILVIVFIAHRVCFFTSKLLLLFLQQILGFCEVRWVITTISQRTIVLLLTIVSTKRLSNCSFVRPLVQIFQQLRLHHPPTDKEVQTGLTIMTIESEATAQQILTLRKIHFSKGY